MTYEFFGHKVRRLTIHDGASISDPAGIIVVTERVFVPGYPPFEIDYCGWRARLLRRLVVVLLPRPPL